MQVILTFKHTLGVCVDTDSGKVLYVVKTEDIDYDPTSPAIDRNAESSDGPVPPELVAKALDIAEGEDVEWPAWIWN